MTFRKTLKYKLLPSTEERLSLLKTLSRFNEALNLISRIAFLSQTFSRNKLHKLAYQEVKSQVNLPARLICEAIRQVSWAYKRRRGQLISFDSSSFHLHQQAFKLKGNTCSILTADGRREIPVSVSDYHLRHKDYQHKEAKIYLDFRKKEVYLLLTVEKEVSFIKPEKVIGVDIGRNNLATCPTGLNFKDRRAEAIRRHFARLRSLLQSRGTRSARRRLKALSRRENGILTSILHQISRRIVKEALRIRAAIALEDLRYIRSRAKVRKEHRYLHHSWAFRKLQNFITYKALEQGILIIWVSPYLSSKSCARCGSEGIRSGELFRCPSCGYQTFADYNGAHNIRLRGQDLLSRAWQGSLIAGEKSYG